MLNSYTYGSVALNSQVTSEPITPNIPDEDYGNVKVSKREFVRQFFNIVGQKLFPTSMEASFIGKVLVPNTSAFDLNKSVAYKLSESFNVNGKKKFVARYAYSLTAKKLMEGHRFYGFEKIKSIPVNAGFNFKKKHLIKAKNYKEITGKKLVHASSKKFIVGQKDTPDNRNLLLYLMAMGD